MKKFSMYPLGEFEIKSGEVIVSDPCYAIGTWCQGLVRNVKNGTWVADVACLEESGRNAFLVVHHKDYIMPMGTVWEQLDFDIGVDSGQAGFYDYAGYKKDDSVPGSIKNTLGFDLNEPGEKFYAFNCDLTLKTEHDAGVLPTGAVASSGYGDGSYTVSVVKDEEGKVVAMEVIFIDVLGNTDEYGDPIEEEDDDYEDLLDLDLFTTEGD